MSKPKPLTPDVEMIKTIHDYDLDVANFQIYLVGRDDSTIGDDTDFGEPGVEYRMANRFIKNIDILSNIDPARPIIINMKTNGGEISEGMAIYDSIMAAPNPVTILNYTHARSMSSIILQAANKRIMMPNSHFMFHMGTEAIGGSAKAVRSAIDFNRKFDDTMNAIYAERMKNTPDSKVSGWDYPDIIAWLNEQMNQREDVYLTGAEAVAWGFADEIFSGWDSITEYTGAQRNIK